MRRHAIEVPGLQHGDQPIPMASRVGNLLMSGGISGQDPATGQVPDTLEAQVPMLFANVARVVEAAGGTVDDIVKFTFFVRDRTSRELINREWTAMFPDAPHRPARHTLTFQLPEPFLVQCDITAFLPSDVP